MLFFGGAVLSWRKDADERGGKNPFGTGETDRRHYPKKYFYTGKEKILLLAEKR